MKVPSAKAGGGGGGGGRKREVDPTVYMEWESNCVAVAPTAAAAEATANIAID